MDDAGLASARAAPLPALKIDKVRAVRGEQSDGDPGARDLRIRFDLGDGNAVEHQFSAMHDVLQLKAFLEAQCGLPIVSQEMHFDGRIMANPLCLADFPGIAESRSATIVVSQRQTAP